MEFSALAANLSPPGAGAGETGNGIGAAGPGAAGIVPMRPMLRAARLLPEWAAVIMRACKLLIALATAVAQFGCATTESLHTRYVVSEDRQAGTVDVTPSAESAIVKAHDRLWSGRAASQEERALYLRAAQTYFLESGRVCRIFEGTPTALGWQFKYQC